MNISSQEPSPSVEADAEVAEALLRHAELAEAWPNTAKRQLSHFLAVMLAHVGFRENKDA